MPTELKVPNLGDGVDSGNVLEVLVSVGDSVAKDQGLIEVEAGKATLQVPAEKAGKIVKLHVSSGQSVKPGDVLVTLEGDGAMTAAPKAEKPAPAAVPTKQAPAPQPKAEAKPAAASTPAPKPAPAPQAAAAPASAAVAISEGPDVAAGPAIRRFAREVGVDLSRVTGTGEGGRITREDVLTAVRQASSAAATGGNGTKAKSSSTATAQDNWGPIRVEKMSRIRKVIAEQMHRSWTTCPRVTNFDDADVTELEKIRQTSKEDYAKRGVKLTSLPFVIKAVATALKDHPAVNASVDLESEQITYKEYVNIGIAVDTERGLVVPSLRNADHLSIADIARGLSAITDKVRDGSFSMADLQGSTFTVSNLGAVGGTYSTPIINTPEVAILLIGRSRKLPVVMEDDSVKVRLMMPLSLAYDHRLVDGATAARFLNDVIEYLEAPGRLLLAP
jgi:pyruvate dehydrogenase complex dihydrolipoamide acetyltransferase long form